MLRIHEIKLKPEEELSSIPDHIKKKLRMNQLEIAEWKLAKESVDARDKQDIRRVYSVDFTVRPTAGKTEAEAESDVLRTGERRKLKLAAAPDTRYRFVTERFGGAQAQLQAGRGRLDETRRQGGTTRSDKDRRQAGSSRSDKDGRQDGQGQREAAELEDNRAELTSPPVVVGFGPCGMFAALLLAQMGYRPVVLERGKAIDERVEDVERFWRDGVLDPESNVQFGEGGAGSFSDGKLTTQIKDQRIRKVLEELTAAGGGEDLLYKQKPHVGTDVLREVVKNIRQEILRLGGTVEFESCVTGLLFQETNAGSSPEENAESRRALAGLKLRKKGNREGEHTAFGRQPGHSAEPSSQNENQNGNEHDNEQVVAAEAAILALGHSARDTFLVLHGQGVPMEQKPFSMGVRIEHPQKMVNEAQYGKNYKQYGLGAADYKLSHRCKNGRGVYTFCMCPGGRVIASASQEGGVVTNGMSYRDRGLENANSALLADVRTEDFGSGHPLAGIEFQERWERLAFEAGGRTYRAPAQRVDEFLAEGRKAEAEGSSAAEGSSVSDGSTAAEESSTAAAGGVKPSYEPGVTWTSLNSCLPDFVADALREALPELGKKLRGFDRPDAVLTALESRSSSPVRIPRMEDGTCGIEGLYAGGEGAGYAGGITSAAVDGIRLAEAIALKYRPLAARSKIDG